MIEAGSALPFAIAHRGGDEVFRQNTTEAFEHAAEIGYRRLETDVWLTEAGLLAIHGTQADGTESTQDDQNSYIYFGGESKPLTSITPQDRQDFAKHGLSIPNLEEVLAIGDEQIHWNIDAKHLEAVEPLTDILRKLGAFPRVTLASFDEEASSELRFRSPYGTSTALTMSELMEIYSSSMTGETVDKDFLPANGRAQIPTKFGDIDLITEPILAAARRANIPVDVWTINERSMMQSLISAGVDGIFTDKLSVLKTALEEQGRSVSD